MSISASDKDWAELERDRPDSENTPDLQEEFVRVLKKAVKELDLSWSSSDEPVKSKLDSWYFQEAGLKLRRRSTQFFPDVHEHIGKIVLCSLVCAGSRWYTCHVHPLGRS